MKARSPQKVSEVPQQGQTNPRPIRDLKSDFGSSLCVHASSMRISSTDQYSGRDRTLSNRVVVDRGCSCFFSSDIPQFLFQGSQEDSCVHKQYESQYMNANSSQMAQYLRRALSHFNLPFSEAWTVLFIRCLCGHRY